MGNLEGSVEVEPLLAQQPDLIVSWIWDKDNPASSQVAIPEELTEQVASIAPIIFLTQGDANDVDLGRIEAFAEAMGVDLTVLFASYGSEDRIYVASPNYAADLGQVRDLGVKLANEGSSTATTYWEEFSLEQALYYPSDVVYIDQFGVWLTLEELQAEPTVSQHPAVKAAQGGPWKRELPLNYAGLTTFPEFVLGPLRDAAKVS